MKLFTFLILLVLLVPQGALWAATDTAQPTTLTFQTSMGGSIVYTGDALDTNADGVVDTEDNDIMFSIPIGADPVDGRFQIIGGEGNIAAYPRLSQDGEIVLCHAFVADTNNDGRITEDRDMPIVGILNADGTGVTPMTVPGEAAAFEAEWSLDESSITFVYADKDTDNDGIVTVNDAGKLAYLEVGDRQPGGDATQFATQAALQVLTDESLSVSRPQFWDNNLIVFEAKITDSDLRQVHTYDLTTGELKTIAPPEGESWNPVPSPDKTRLAVEVATAEGQSVWMYSRDTDNWVQVSPAGATATSPTWSPDGESLAMATTTDAGSEIILLDNSGQTTFVESEGEIKAAEFSPAGDSIAYAAVLPETGNTAIEVASLDGSFAATLTPADTNVADFTWNPASGERPESSAPLNNFVFNGTDQVAVLPSKIQV